MYDPRLAARRLKQGEHKVHELDITFRTYTCA